MNELNIDNWLDQIGSATNLANLDDIRVKLLGKKGVITIAMEAMKDLSVDEKKQRGPLLNNFKNAISDNLAKKKETLESDELAEKLANDKIDITLPGDFFELGVIHPLTRAQLEMINYFENLGFHISDGPEIESPEINFDALNVPKDHPARAMQDTFYMADGNLLRTHTSNIQIHTLKNKKPPLRILAPGRVYRSDAADATHSPMFFQMEGFVVDEGIHMGHLKSLLIDFCKHFFEADDLQVRFRPSFFPFTEPSAEVDIGAFKENGQLKLAKSGNNEAWLEVLGCGMIHPNVLSNCGLDPNIYQGFAFGMGLDRLAMLKYGISDIRDLYNNKGSWLSHFTGVCA